MAVRNKSESNRRNAQKSTGPRSSAGKDRSRENALKHGLAALRIIDSKRAGAVEELALALADEGIALGAARDLAQAAIDLQWIRKVRAASLNQIIADDADIDATDNLLTKVRRIDRYEKRALARQRRIYREIKGL